MPTETSTEIPALPFVELFKNTTLSAKESLVNQIYHILWELITTAQLLPGQLLSEKELSENLKASRTPVREALIRLEEAGLVYVIPKSGTYVSAIRISSYLEACFIRLQLECGSARRAAQRINSQQSYENLSAIIDAQAEALHQNDYSRFFQLDEHLHESIFIIAGIAGVWKVLRRTQFEVHRIRHLNREYQLYQGAQILNEHRLIVESITRGDGDAAHDAMSAHLGPLEREIEQLTASPELLKFIEQQNTDKPRSRRRSH